LGSDLHTSTEEELPGVYTNPPYNRFVYYGGTSPWTNGVVTVTQFQPLGIQDYLRYAPEHWGAHVDTQNMGLTVFVPSQYPFVGGFDAPANGTNYFLPFTSMTIFPNLTFQEDFYVIAGDVISARQNIYGLHQKLGPPPNIFGAVGATDFPMPGSTISGTATASGWAFDNVVVTKIEVLVDGVADGVATYGSPRPDVAGTYPHAAANIGYSYSLDTTKYADGPHILNVRVTDSSGNVAVLPNVAITVSNAVPGAGLSQRLEAKPRPRNPFTGRRFETTRQFRDRSCN